MKKIKDNLGLFIISATIILITILSIVIQPYTYTSRDGSSNSYSDSNKLNTNYLSISDVSVTSNSLYTICNGTISVKSNSPYKYRNIQVKGAFKNSRGTTLDTDWTFAIGSEWLEPGESSKFSLSVKKDSSITKCSVSIME